MSAFFSLPPGLARLYPNPLGFAFATAKRQFQVSPVIVRRGGIPPMGKGCDALS